MTHRSVANLRTVEIKTLTGSCPAATGRTKTRQPVAALERWSMLRDLLVDRWANPGEPTEDVLSRHLEVLSPLEADLIRRMFNNVARVFPLESGAEVDLEGRKLWYDHEEAGMSVPVAVTFTFDHPDGTTEHVRLKSGRRGTTPEEAAVLWSQAEEGESFVDLMAWSGEVETIAEPSEAEARLSRLVEEAPVDRSGIRPGPECVWCRRAAVCGAYPAPRAVPTTAQTVNLTKTDLADLSRCARRVAWRRVHGIPRDDAEEADVVDRATRGRLFHGMVAAAEGAEDLQQAAETYLAGVPPSEVAELQLLWEGHRRLIEEEGLAVRKVEFPVGATFLEGEGREMSGATVIGFVDLTARDGDGQPVCVELKTGSPGDTGVEDDLYAVGMRRWIPDGPIVIHRHYVRFEPPVCELVTMDTASVDAAWERLRQRAEPVGDWDWDDPLQPAYSTGPWCNGCEFRSTCESYR